MKTVYTQSCEEKTRNVHTNRKSPLFKNHSSLVCSEWCASVNARFADLLKTERELIRKSVTSICLELRINPSELRHWESGKASPPAYIFYRLVTFYGAEAYERASMLWLDVQIERYKLLTAPTHTKRPKEQFAQAA